MIQGPIIWIATIRNAIMGDQVDSIERWFNNPKFGYDAKLGLSDYKDFLSGKPNKYLQWQPTDYEVMKFREYENILHHTRMVVLGFK